MGNLAERPQVSKPMGNETESLYDHPAWYDLAYGADWRYEFHFLRWCFRHLANRHVRRVFEPACGTGRLLLPLARAGYRVSGLDLNAYAIAYCNARLVRHKHRAAASVGDMTRFRLPRPVDAAFNMINSFRHLPSEAAARAHLQCMARAVAHGGLYVLGLHLTPERGKATRAERWAARRGHLALTVEMRTVSKNLKRREERVRSEVNVYTPQATHRLIQTHTFRTYTARQFARLLTRIPEWETAATYDFSYNVREPIVVGPATEDVVYVLRRSSGK